MTEGILRRVADEFPGMVRFILEDDSLDNEKICHNLLPRRRLWDRMISICEVINGLEISF